MALLMLTNQMQENMVRAQKRDAVRSEKFYFRKSVVPDDDDDDDVNEGAGPKRSHDHEYTEMSVDTIINGKVCPFPYHNWSLFHSPGMDSGRVPRSHSSGEDVCQQYRDGC